MRGKNPQSKSPLVIGHSQERQQRATGMSVRVSGEHTPAMEDIWRGPSNTALGQRFGGRNFFMNLSLGFESCKS